MLYITSYILSLSFYLLSALLSKKYEGKIRTPLFIIAFFGHLSLIYNDFFLKSFNFDFSNALMIVSAMTVFFYILFNTQAKNKGLDKIIAIPTILIIIFHGIFSQEHLIRDTDSIFYLAHIIIAILAYGLLTYSAIFATFVLFLEEGLHKKKTLTNFSSTNSIMGMEKFLFIILWSGFLLLSITIFTGIFFSNEIFNTPFIFNHKTFFGILSWISYAYILYQRVANGIRGRKAVLLVLLAFLLLVLAYFGSKFVSEIILN
jgi:ABC-type uncharacterized transport system permease subunit